MVVELLLLGKLQIALVTLEAFLCVVAALVPFHVELERALAHEGLHAHFTLERSRIGVLSLVVDQVTLRRKALSASFELAAERLLACVDAHVSLEVPVLSEAGATDLTFERFLASVRSLVDLESAGARIRLATDLATVWFLSCMDQNVRLQMALGDEGLATTFEGAGEGPVVGVRSHVSFQVACLCELLDTLRIGTEKHPIRSGGATQHLEVGLSGWQRLVVRLLFSIGLSGLLASFLALV